MNSTMEYLCYNCKKDIVSGDFPFSMIKKGDHLTMRLVVENKEADIRRRICDKMESDMIVCDQCPEEEEEESEEDECNDEED